MRVLFTFIVLVVSLSLSGCPRPHQAAHAKPLPSSWENPQSRPSPPKRIKESSTKSSQAVSQRPKRNGATSGKPTQVVRKLPGSNGPSSVPPLPPRKPELAHIKPPATDAESPPPLPPRKSEQTPTSASDSREHAVEPEGKFMAAKEKAKREGVHSLTSEDIDGLSDEQIKQLRGY
jgi:hypothetical protein